MAVFEIAEYIGIIAFVISGFLVGVRNKLDLLGILISTFLTAFGGGLIRDVIANKIPYTFTHTAPGAIVIILMLAMIIFKTHKKPNLENRALFIISDSIGLVSFSISGALVALTAGYNLTGVMALSFITAVGGGITRDVIINEVPFVFKTGFYGTVALLVGLLIYLLNLLDFINFFTLLIVFIVGIIVRIVAFYRKWSVPLI